MESNIGYSPSKEMVLKKGFGGRYKNTSLEVILFQDYDFFLTILKWVRCRLQLSNSLRRHAEWLFQAAQKIKFPMPRCAENCSNLGNNISVRQSRDHQRSVSFDQVYCDQHMIEIKQSDHCCYSLPWELASMKFLKGNDNLIFTYWKDQLGKTNLSGHDLFKLLRQVSESLDVKTVSHREVVTQLTLM